jgi:carboxypeptidase C (cathepsin A)
VSFAYYEAGHMMYIDDTQRHKLHQDMTEFIRSAYRP